VASGELIAVGLIRGQLSAAQLENQFLGQRGVQDSVNVGLPSRV
jgi:hypothetical protein